MKIDGPGKTAKSAQTGKGKKNSSAAGSQESFNDYLVDTSGDSRANAPAAAVSATDLLLSVQSADDPAERAARGRMEQRADMILDKLESIRTALLIGELKAADMIEIADMVARHREKIMDPVLTSLLDEIDLRAQIELAKMTRALATSFGN